MSMPLPTPEDTPQTYWDGFYGGPDRPAHRVPTPNALFVAEVEALAPGRALDLGCGLGGDAIWLVGRGWRVTAVDVSGEVLRRARGYAALAGVEVDWQRHDLTATFPDGAHDLVCAQFLHSPLERPGQRDAILRRALDAVAPGGSLLVTGHAGIPDAMRGTAFDVHLPSTAELRAALAPDPTLWTVATERTTRREVTGPDGVPFTRADTVLRLVLMSD
jgi:SAM-dependent methyltransferase